MKQNATIVPKQTKSHTKSVLLHSVQAAYLVSSIIISTAGSISMKSEANYRRILFDSFSIVAFSISLKVFLPAFFTISRTSQREGIATISPILPIVANTGLGPVQDFAKCWISCLVQIGISEERFSNSFNALWNKQS